MRPTLHVIILVIVLLLPGVAATQGRYVLVDWEIPGTSAELLADIELLQRVGARGVLVHALQEPTLLQDMLSRGLQIWVRSGNRFHKSNQHPFSEEQLQQFTDPLYFYRNAGIPVSGYIAQEFPRFDEDYPELMAPIFEELRSVSTRPIYLLLSEPQWTQAASSIQQVLPAQNLILALDDNTEIRSYPGIAAYYYAVSPKIDGAAMHLRTLFLQTPAQTTVVVNIAQLRHWQHSQPEALQVIQSFSSDAQAVIALQSFRTNTPTDVLPAVLLLLLWGVFLTFYMLSGGYHRSLIRYFTTHNFYINDLMMRRIKPGNEIFISLLIPLLSAGVLSILFFSYAINPIAAEFLANQSTMIEIAANNGAFPQFLFGVGVFTLTIIPGLLWFMITTVTHVQPVQLLQMYLLPLQLLLAFTSLAIIALLNGLGAGATLLLINLAGLTVFLAPLFTAIDVYAYMQLAKSRFLWRGAISFHLMAAGLMVWWMLSNEVLATVGMFLHLMP